MTPTQIETLINDAADFLEPAGPELCRLFDVSAEATVNFEGDVWLIVDGDVALIVEAMDMDDDGGWVGTPTVLNRVTMPRKPAPQS